MRTSRRWWQLIAVLAVAVVGVVAGIVWVVAGPDDDAAEGDPAADDGVEVAGETVTRDEDAIACDPMVAAHCLLPFPNDAFTVADDTADTGRRVALTRDAMPSNADGVPVDPTDWNRSDGFSPGSPILVHVPGLDLDGSGIAPITDIGRSLDADAPVVLLDLDTGERHPFWAELDAQADDPAMQVLIVRPARNLEEGHHYAVALRDLVGADGSAIPAPEPFVAVRDGEPSSVPEMEARREHLESLLLVLEDAGIARDELYLAWDFTVASASNLTEGMLHIRDDAFASIDDAPDFSVTGVETDVNELVGRRVEGTFAVPLYLTGEGGPGDRLTRGDDGLPERNGTWNAPFRCNISYDALDAEDPEPARGTVYGHGLLGGNEEVDAENVHRMVAEHNMVYCATNWIGMSSDDIPAVVEILGDLSGFGAIPDRLRQGMLNTLFLARLLRDPAGFASHEAFRAPDATPVLRPGEVFYDGNSQGGIMGAAATAVSTEWERAVLGVPGMNYSTLLDRSVDFEPFRPLFARAYPDVFDQALLLPLMQMLWDRGEANGYAHHLTDDPPEGTPEHRVLLHVAWNDHQVAPVTAGVMARTASIPVRMPALVAGRTEDANPFWGIEALESFPSSGSAMVVWDSGTPDVPGGNAPPLGPEYGDDPHENPRSQRSAREQKSRFLEVDGVVVDVCDGLPCEAPSS